MITMIIFTLQPLIDFLTEWLLLRFDRWYNRKFVYTPEKQDNVTSRLNV